MLWLLRTLDGGIVRFFLIFVLAPFMALCFYAIFMIITCRLTIMPADKCPAKRGAPPKERSVRSP